VKLKGFKIAPVKSGDAGSIYTIQFEGESQTEFDKFLLSEGGDHQSDAFERLLSQLDVMVNKYGFLEDFFKIEEGCRLDYVVALRDLYLRLYCLRIDDALLVVGNGGVKNTQTYQEDARLYASVTDLQMVHKVIMSKINSGLIRYDRVTGTLCGSLNLYQ